MTTPRTSESVPLGRLAFPRLPDRGMLGVCDFLGARSAGPRRFRGIRMGGGTRWRLAFSRLPESTILFGPAV